MADVALVTGGAGFIGSHIVEELSQRGFKVRVLDSLIKGKLSSIQPLIDEGCKGRRHTVSAWRRDGVPPELIFGC